MRMRGIATPWEGQFQLDELETFEHNRRLKPVTVPVLVHKPSYCILHAEVGTLPARKPLSKANLAKLARYEQLEGDVKRKSESREKMTRCFECSRAFAIRRRRSSSVPTRSTPTASR
ncbi:MAG: hypothetical protein IPJ19_16030 [Planctomycetes bacterium]|nr:hypothetical protein [Planctomycetota bacterium]